MTNQTNQTQKLARAAFLTNTVGFSNPWGSDEYDRLEFSSFFKKDEYEKNKELIQNCRFFYKHDPLAATTINKMIDIGITPIIVDQGSLSVSEYAAIKSMRKQVQEFLEVIALEFLISGLAIPEITYKEFPKIDLTRYGIKRYQSLILPESLFIRDSATIKINQSFLSDKPSYFVKIPDSVIQFIISGGTYVDGTVDKVAYAKLATYYPELIVKVKNGETEILLENDSIIRGKYLTDSPYPIPYLSPALESLKHKRNIRRMDYSIAARVIGAIQHVTLGSDEFPAVEGDEDQFTDIREQMRHRYSSDANQDIERIFQLFTNHTVAINWISPDVDALLDDAKYSEVNQDIIFALGFPRILITGESERTGTSDPQYAMMSPQKTMENIRAKLLNVAVKIVYDVLEKNSFKGLPGGIRFEEINLHEFTSFVTGLSELYNSGNLSRESYSKYFGYDINEELNKRADENAMLKEMGLTEFGPVPFSPAPAIGEDKSTDTEKKDTKEEKNTEEE